uniref:Uncharacterized protein n=1 Tax=Escherichia coli TaxID=562 RepID=A0A221ZRF5_ECOLX|nr:hypothetical protein [Escherichia coli]ASO65124.1 hypothetical protein [Escherichia coli]
MPVCRNWCIAFFDIRMNRRLIFSGCNIPEQHLKALSVAVRFNPLNRQTGVLSSCRPSVLSWVAITCSHNAKCTC